MDRKGLTALKDAVDRYRLTVKDSKFAPLRKKVDECLKGFSKNSVDGCIAIACESIDQKSTDAIIRASLDIMEVVLSYELTRDSKQTGTIVRAICAAPRGRGDDLTHKVLRNLSRCEVHHFIDIQVFEMICSTIFELMNSAVPGSSVDGSARAGLAHLLSNRLVRYEQPRTEQETDDVVGTPDYVAAVVLMKAMEISQERADIFFEIVANLFRECPTVLTHPKSADLILRHVLPRCLQRPRHATALTILGSIVAVFEEQAYPFAEIIFQCALIPGLAEKNTACDVMTVFLDIARKPHVIAGLLKYYDCSGGARGLLVQEWIAAVCAACDKEAVAAFRGSFALFLKYIVAFFQSLTTSPSSPSEKQESTDESRDDATSSSSSKSPILLYADNEYTNELVRLCDVGMTQRKTALIFNQDMKAGIAAGVANGTIKSNSDQDVGAFLHNKYLDKVQIGQFVAKRERKDVLKAFIDNFDFKGISIDLAMRRMMGSFKMVGEADIVDRTTDYYAMRYVDENPGAFLQDTLAILAFSTMMLNTDQHSPHVKTKMTMDEFIRNNRGIDNGKDVPREVLEGVYNRIKAEEIVLEKSLGEISPQAAAAMARNLYGELNPNVNNDGTGGSTGGGGKGDGAASAAAAGQQSTSDTSSNHPSAVLAPPPTSTSESETENATADINSKKEEEPAPTTNANNSNNENDEKAKQQQQQSRLMAAPLDSRIARIILEGSNSAIVKAISSLVVSATSREASITAISGLVQLVCHMDMRDALAEVVHHISGICRDDKFIASVRLSTLTLLIDSVLEHVEKFQASWTDVARSIASCAQFGQDADTACVKLVEQIPQLAGANLSAFLVGFIEVATKSKEFLSPDAFLMKLIMRGAEFTCKERPQLWKETLWPRALPHFKRAIFDFPTTQCADALDRLCAASLAATAQCTDLILFVCREFSIKDPSICLTFLRTAYLIELPRCSKADFDRLISIYDTLSRATDVEVRFKAFDSFKSNLLDVVLSSSSSKNYNQTWKCMAMRVASTFASHIPTGAADEPLFACCAEIAKSQQQQKQDSSSSSSSSSSTVAATVLLCASCIASLVTLVDCELERRQRALARLLELYLTHANSNTVRDDEIAGALIGLLLIPLFETLTDSVADVHARTNSSSNKANKNQGQQDEGDAATATAAAQHQDAADRKAATEAAVNAHVELSVQLFNVCVPLDKERPLKKYEVLFLSEALKHSLGSVYECTQAVAMTAIKSLAQTHHQQLSDSNNNSNNNSSSTLDATAWDKVTGLVDGIITQTSRAFLHGDAMTEHHTRFWNPLLACIGAHCANPTKPTPLVGPRLSKSFAGLLSVCSRASNRNMFLLDFEKDVLRLGCQVSIAAKDFERIGDMGTVVSSNVVEFAAPVASSASASSSPATSVSPERGGAVGTIGKVDARNHALKSATQFVEWIAHLEHMELFVAAVRAAYPSLCDLIKCGDCTVGTALSLVFHRLAPVVVGMPKPV